MLGKLNEVMQSRRKSYIFRLCALFLAVGFSAWPLQTVDPASLPKPTGYVSDLAHVISPEAKNQLEQFCAQVEQQLGVQFALVTIDTLHDQPIEDFAIKLARQWGVGDKKNNQGVLLLLAINDRKSDIEAGRGMEPLLGDGFSGSILRSIRPDLRDSNYGAALSTAARDMARQIAQAKGVPFNAQSLPEDRDRTRETASHRGRGMPGWLIFVGVFFLLWLLGSRWRSAWRPRWARRWRRALDRTSAG